MADSAASSDSAGTRFCWGAPTGISRAVRHAVHAPGLLASLLVLAQPIPVAAQATSGYGQPIGVSPQDRQIFGNGSGSGSAVGPAGSSSGIDINNPIDLINKIRRSTALDDATPPASAVDQALKALEAQSGPAPAGPAAGGRSVVSPPTAGGLRPASGPATLPGSP